MDRGFQDRNTTNPICGPLFLELADKKHLGSSGQLWSAQLSCMTMNSSASVIVTSASRPRSDHLTSSTSLLPKPSEPAPHLYLSFKSINATPTEFATSSPFTINATTTATATATAIASSIPSPTPPSSNPLDSTSLHSFARSLSTYITCGAAILGIVILIWMGTWFWRCQRRKQRFQAYDKDEHYNNDDGEEGTRIRSREGSSRSSEEDGPQFREGEDGDGAPP
ncbi:hypothetical protein IAR55_006212 [Kwoniella newhampshirensis]|uniref:Mid2 domain-containing protein n=1 Tax=Kwoniella newhampshirensis TaxID=1651941 RepID=A0AAW0YK34_9TREE